MFNESTFSGKHLICDFKNIENKELLNDIEQLKEMRERVKSLRNYLNLDEKLHKIDCNHIFIIWSSYITYKFKLKCFQSKKKAHTLNWNGFFIQRYTRNYGNTFTDIRSWTLHPKRSLSMWGSSKNKIDDLTSGLNIFRREKIIKIGCSIQKFLRQCYRKYYRSWI